MVLVFAVLVNLAIIAKLAKLNVIRLTVVVMECVLVIIVIATLDMMVSAVRNAKMILI